jgi:hypothetical protein
MSDKLLWIGVAGAAIGVGAIVGYYVIPRAGCPPCPDCPPIPPCPDCPPIPDTGYTDINDVGIKIQGAQTFIAVNGIYYDKYSTKQVRVWVRCYKDGVLQGISSLSGRPPGSSWEFAEQYITGTIRIEAGHDNGTGDPEFEPYDTTKTIII